MKILFQYQPVLLSKLWTILTKMKRSGKAKLRPVDPNLQTSDQILLRNGRRKGFMPGNPPLHFSLYLKSDLDSNRTVKLMSSRSLIASKRFKTFGWVVFFFRNFVMLSRKIYSSHFIYLLCQVLNPLSWLGVVCRKCARKAGVDCSCFYFYLICCFVSEATFQGSVQIHRIHPRLNAMVRSFLRLTSRTNLDKHFVFSAPAGEIEMPWMDRTTDKQNLIYT